jgi:hypothetical protein
MLVVAPGDDITVQVILSGDLDDKNDSAVFRLVFSEPGLEFSSGWHSWGLPYVTGGIDDFSDPASSVGGIVDASIREDAAFPGEADLYFENLTENFGEFFAGGTLLTLSLQVPVSASPGVISIDFDPLSFTAGTAFVDVAVGEGLTVQIVPAPSAWVGVGVLGGLAGVPRRRG